MESKVKGKVKDKVKVLAKCVCCWYVLKTGRQAKTLSFINFFILFGAMVVVCLFSITDELQGKLNYKS